MKTFEVGGTTLSLALFLDVSNSKELLDLMQAGTLEPEVAFLNASLIPDVFPVLAAANKTLVAKSRESLTTRTLHSELVYNYSGSKHISESLKRCGISDTTSYILAARFGASADEMAAIKGLIKGTEIGLEELGTRADQALIQKQYKISAPELGISSLPDAITCRIAARDALNSPFQPHSTPSATENINLNADADFGNEGTVLQQKKTKCSARWRWSCKENEHLARCWVSINKDTVIPNDKKLDQMWIRIAREYNKNRPANTRERHWEAMKTHFYTLQRSLIAFNADYIAVKEACESSRNDVDILMETLKRWVEKHGNQTFKLLGMWQILSECPKWANQDRDQCCKKKEACESSRNDVDILMETLKRWVEKHGNQTFKLLGMWQILSECPKWANQDRDQCCKKKVRTSTPEVSISSSNNENDVEDRTRPIDQKAAKRKAKAKVGVYEEFIETLDKNMAEYRAISEQKLKEIRYRNKKREYDILMKDTSGMTQEQLRIHQHFCEEIKKKWGIW